MSTELIIDNLVVVRGTKVAVNGIKLKLTPGKVTALLGPNGAGKTSTVLGLSGVVEPAFGQILLDDQDLKGLDSDVIRRNGVATVPEGHQVLQELSVRENLLIAAGDLKGDLLHQAIAWVLEMFPELKTLQDHRAGDLSGGQQQMVAIAQSLVVTPRFLVIDELSFGLGPAVVTRLVPIIRRIADEGIGVLLIEQFTQLALALADHVYVLSRGNISYDGGPDKLRKDPDILHKAYFPVNDRAAVGLG
ncbi:MAG: ATP-binding cassette domain-containing protein [Porticoccaceae bacterium]|nr:ATP-binding cassette domain-containing protein [Porticoccaceae bacterium]